MRRVYDAAAPQQTGGLHIFVLLNECCLLKVVSTESETQLHVTSITSSFCRRLYEYTGTYEQVCMQAAFCRGIIVLVAAERTSKFMNSTPRSAIHGQRCARYTRFPAEI